MTIPSTDITIDGDTAWLIAPADKGYIAEYLNRPCDLCVRYAAVGHPVYGTLKGCTDCHGTGRHTFTLDVECEWCVGYGYLLGAPDHYEAGTDAVVPCIDDGGEECNDGSRTITVHVVEVLPIVDRDGSIDLPGRLVTHHVMRGVMGSSVTTSIWDGRNHLKIVTLPASAAPGKYAVRLAVHA